MPRNTMVQLSTS